MRVVILDTACANLSSVAYAIQRLGYQPVISRDPDIVHRADRLFLPGVGTAQAAMHNLQDKGLISLIAACTQPVLGICLGMQLLGKHSEEGNTATLGISSASVKRISDQGLPLPHMGWNRVYALADNPLFRGITDGSHFYFVHGYAMAICSDTIAHTQYGDTFSAAIQKDNFFGVQFHPERSGEAGAQLIKNFLQMETP